MDLRLGHLLAVLRLAPNCGTLGETLLPKTGGRWLVTLKNCERQILHTDFDTASPHINDDSPAYFLICTGSNESPVWVVEGSHWSVKNISNSKARAPGEGSVERKVFIPPYSVFIGCGDLFHADCGMEGRIPSRRLVYGKQSLRYHIHCFAQQYGLPNEIHMRKEFSNGVLSMGDLDDDDDAEEEEEEEEE